MSENVKVVESSRPDDFSFTRIPEPIVKHFRSRNLHLSWQRYDPHNVSRIFGMGMKPVQVEDLKEANPELYELARQAMFVNPEGYFQNFDCILVAQSVEARERFRRIFDQRLEERESGMPTVEALENEMQQVVQSTGKATGQPLLRGEVPHAAEYGRVANVPGVRFSSKTKK